MTVIQQTANWIANHINLAFYNYFPQVICTSEKGEICKNLDIKYFLDDKEENLIDIKNKSPQTKCFSTNWKYNENSIFPKIKNLSEYFEHILHAEELQKISC